MCGIIGLIRKEGDVVGEVIKGLQKLEYRGYDSVGLAVIDPKGELVVRKGAGDLESVRKRLGLDELKGSVAIGHTRWATHGPPNDVNAHPHTDCHSLIALVHNGVIRNYSSLRSELEERHKIRSETDTELIAHIIEEYLKESNSFLEALAKTLRKLEGSYALAIIYKREPGRIYFAKMKSPLILGIKEEVGALASDVPALLDITRDVIMLNDGEFGYIEPGDVKIFKLNDDGSFSAIPKEEISLRIKTVEWSPELASKGGYPHFMIKEIYEQPQALANTYNGLAEDPALIRAAEVISGSGKIIVVGAGTSFHAGLVFNYFMTRIAKRTTIPIIASEFKVLEPAVEEGDVVVAISQSGETFDTLEAVRTFKSSGAKIVALTNVVGSALDREADLTLYIRAGPEIGVAATKTYTSQILALELLALETARVANKIDTDSYKMTKRRLMRAGDYLQNSIEISDPIAKYVAKTLNEYKGSIYILGRGLGHFIAKEAALKIKEIAYLHAEAYPAGESKHGPIALIEDGFPVYVIATSDSPEIIGNAIEMAARGANVTVLRPEDLLLDIPTNEAISVINLPKSEGNLLIEPFILIPFFQLLSYYVAVIKGYNPDKPRNLAKTVTVE
jgi:glucosamine--fructose-6-phosphate aminotransferase (isomerizing)